MAEHGLPVRGGPPVAAAERFTGVWPCSHSGGWELTKSWGKGRGAPGVLTMGSKGRHSEGVRPAAVNGGSSRRGSVGMCFGAGRGEKSIGRSCGWGRWEAGAFYRAREMGAEAVGE
jgi:hypothetical protein